MVYNPVKTIRVFGGVTNEMRYINRTKHLNLEKNIMKQIYLSILFSFLYTFLPAQQASETVAAASVKANILSAGGLFSSNAFTNGFSLTNLDGNYEELPTIFASGLWIGAKLENEDSYKISRIEYAPNQEFQPGPINYSGGFNFNRIWKVTGKEIESHKADYSDGTIDDEPAENILDWPGYGNELLGPEFPIQEFAAFFDQDGDGIYNPYAGDYPLISEELNDVIPHEMAFSIYNDDIEIYNPIRIEIHLTMYSLDYEEGTPLDRAIFTSHKIINKNINIDELYIGHWTVYELGCTEDDYVGCDPDRNVNYCYNKDAVDGDDGTNCSTGAPTYGGNPVVHASKFLNQEMFSFMAYHRNGAGDFPAQTHRPTTDGEIMLFLNGKWRDGSPMTFGGIGYDTSSTEAVNYLFPSNPADPDEWSMITAEIPYTDVHALSTVHHGQLASGASINLDMVQLITKDENYDNIQKIGISLEELDDIQGAYDNQFDNLQNYFTTEVTYQELGDISIHPNPTDHSLTIVQFEDVKTYRIFDVSGRMVNTGRIQAEETTINLNLNDGIYWIRFSTDEGHFTAQKFVIVNK